MAVDVGSTAAYLAPLLTFALGWISDRVSSALARPGYYLLHSSAVTIHPPAPPPTTVHTHAVLIRNSSRKAATNVRLGHAVLTAFSVSPDTPYLVRQLPGGTSEIVFESIPPRSVLVITYLYFPPLLWSQVHTTFFSDAGEMRRLNVQTAVRLPALVNALVVGLFFLGLATALWYSWNLFHQWFA